MEAKAAEKLEPVDQALWTACYTAAAQGLLAQSAVMPDAAHLAINASDYADALVKQHVASAAKWKEDAEAAKKKATVKG